MTETVAITLFALSAVVGLWVAYEALRKAGNARTLGSTLLWMVSYLLGGSVAGFCLLMLGVGLS